jgi:DNA polymerase I-like protein with 3'-5' exonuclease and polymerase domains
MEKLLLLSLEKLKKPQWRKLEKIGENALQTPDFTYCASLENAFPQFENLLQTKNRSIALDIETYGPDPKAGLFPHRGHIRLLTVQVQDSRPVIFDLKRIGPCHELDWSTLFEGRETIAHNAQFEFKWFLHHFGFRIPKIFCTMHAARLLQNGIDGEFEHAGLATVAKRYLGRSISKDEQLSDFGAEFLTLDQIQYAAADVAHLHDLRSQLARLLETAEGGSLMPTFKLDMEYLRIIARRELRGIRWDSELSGSLLQDALETIERTTARLAEIWGANVLLSSPHQVKAAFIKLGFTDIPNTVDDTLAKIDHEAARLMQEYRGAEALKKEVERIAGHVYSDGRIYPEIDQLGSETARVISYRPTINNLSVETGVRSCVLPDSPDHVIIKSDYSREEPRIAASVFNVPALKDDFKAGRDIYLGFAAQIFGVSPESLIAEQIDTGKTNFLGVTYGESAKRLVKSALDKGKTLEPEKAQKIIDAFNILYPEIRDAWRQARRDANRNLISYGTSKLGRRRLLAPPRPQPTKKFIAKHLEPALKQCFGSKALATKIKRLASLPDPPEGKSSKARQKNAERKAKIDTARILWTKWETETLPALMPQILQAWASFEAWRVNWDAQQLQINFKIQGGGSDVIRRAEILVDSRLPEGARILLSNHDEICVSCPKEFAEAVKQILQDAMHEAFNSIYPDVPIETEAEILDTWG